MSIDNNSLVRGFLVTLTTLYVAFHSIITPHSF